MSDLGSRPSIRSLARRPWDLVIVGGGIVGAGLLREASRRGLTALLVEASDFASGTSSRSSKLVHGGLQYLGRGNLGLARTASRSRNRMVERGGSLIRPIDFLLPVLPGLPHSRFKLMSALTAYRFLAGELGPARRLAGDELRSIVPAVEEGVDEAYVYRDAVTDDSGLVLRVLREALNRGGRAASRVEAVSPIRGDEGFVVGVRVRDRLDGREDVLRAEAVVNAAGPWIDGLRKPMGLNRRLRWIRGSHLVLARSFAPNRALVTFHPGSRAPIYLIPWMGRTIVGSTHVEEGSLSDASPSITESEVEYLVRGVRRILPRWSPSEGEIVSTFTGIRPVVDGNNTKPSRASRDHAIWWESGMMSLTGGKLTTFQRMAEEALDELARRIPAIPRCGLAGPPLDAPVPYEGALPGTPVTLPPAVARSIRDRYGTHALRAIATGPEEDRRTVGRLPVLEGEMRWAARNEGVVHLEDLLLRRLRVGIVCREGGWSEIERIRAIVQPALGWNDARWRDESRAYRGRWLREHRPPTNVGIRYAPARSRASSCISSLA